MPKVILTLQRTGGKPHGVVLENARQANDAALALIRGFLIDTCSEPNFSDTAFLLTKGVTRISWTNAYRTHFVTVERA